MTYKEMYNFDGYGHENEEITKPEELKKIVELCELKDINTIKRNVSYYDLPYLEEFIMNKILKSDLKNEDKIQLLYDEAYERHNMFAHYELAKAYKDGEFIVQSDTKYVEILKEISSSEQYFSRMSTIIRKLRDIRIHQYYEIEQYIDMSEWYTSALFYKVNYELGIYFSSSNNMNELEEAELYFNKANEFLPRELKSDPIDAVRAKIVWLKNNNTVSQEKDFAVYDVKYFGRDLSESIKKSEDVFENVKKSLINDFTEEKWDLLSKEAHSYFLTAYYCFLQLQLLGNKHYGEVDFGSVISLALKALEYELDKRFHKGYLNYLRENIKTCEQYCSINNLSINSILQDRRDLFFINNKNKQIEFFNPDGFCSKFTIGSFEFILGIKTEGSLTSLDNTVVSYIAECLYKKLKLTNSQIKDWVIALNNDIGKLRRLRNDASHGGKILTVIDAKDCFDMMLYTKKIMLRLVDPFYKL